MKTLFTTYLEQIKNPEFFTNKQIDYIGEEYLDNKTKFIRWIESEAYKLKYYKQDKEIIDTIKSNIKYQLKKWGIENGINLDLNLFFTPISKKQLIEVIFKTIEIKSKTIKL